MCCRPEQQSCCGWRAPERRGAEIGPTLGEDGTVAAAVAAAVVAGFVGGGGGDGGGGGAAGTTHLCAYSDYSERRKSSLSERTGQLVTLVQYG